DAIRRIVSNHVEGRASGVMRHIYNGHAYRDTVEQVDNNSVEADKKGPAEPERPIVGANRSKDGAWTGICVKECIARDVGSAGMVWAEIAVPLYRHPVPAPTCPKCAKDLNGRSYHANGQQICRDCFRESGVALAPQGVVDEIDLAAH